MSVLTTEPTSTVSREALSGEASPRAIAVLITLPLVGIDLTVLSIFGGALGVGLGFGLQKIASNYMSGFISLVERSIRHGDIQPSVPLRTREHNRSARLLRPAHLTG